MLDPVREPVLGAAIIEKATIDAVSGRFCSDGDSFLCLSHCSHTLALVGVPPDPLRLSYRAAAVVSEALDSHDLRCV